MLGIIILIAIGSGFYKYADSHNLPYKIMWTILGPASYYIAQFLFGIVIALAMPSLLDSTGQLLIIGLVTGFAGVGITYWIMTRQNAKPKTTGHDDDILDDGLTDDLN